MSDAQVDDEQGTAGGHWQLQEAKQRFSALVRAAHTDGPQVVTRHGSEVAVVLDVAEYRRLREGKRTFKDWLLNGPKVEGFEAPRIEGYMREVDFGDAE